MKEQGWEGKGLSIHKRIICSRSDIVFLVHSFFFFSLLRSEKGRERFVDDFFSYYMRNM